ncbi:hypothetical protein LR48_Vigan05g011600 [Vigna angularis]|uniref:NAD-dependent epimerase/dehydratase domain-containing protein n=1 Tax=Phaseolus angularis TaxID=3914 RepID=A0A0L9UIZ4_PHAAN|nr:hypothetical protein LR48_Vigan05g011600 [Vigna angularis]
MTIGVGQLVCVTGASGYIASWLVKFLLERGYTVNATVRDPSDPRKVDHLLSLDGAKERLHLFKANLLEEGSFDSAVQGCHGVFHTASPFFLSSKDPQKWYNLSKTLAEEIAWKFTKENNIDLVTINPAMVIGPLLQPELNTSAAAVLNFVNGAETFRNVISGWVDVKDVANAHILAYENDSANGRYCLVGRVTHNSVIVKMLRDLFPTLQLPEKCADEKLYVPIYQVSKKKAKNLGIKFTPLEVSLKETVESLKEKKLIKF